MLHNEFKITDITTVEVNRVRENQGENKIAHKKQYVFKWLNSDCQRPYDDFIIGS